MTEREIDILTKALMALRDHLNLAAEEIDTIMRAHPEKMQRSKELME